MIGRLLTLYRTGGRQGDSKLNNDANVSTLLAVLMAVVVRPYYTARIAQWRRFMAFLKATKYRHRASTRSDSINQTCLPLIIGVYFIVKSLKNGSSCPNNNRGMTHQSDEKHLNNNTEKTLLDWLN
jgi:hypothetical protein